MLAVNGTYLGGSLWRLNEMMDGKTLHSTWDTMSPIIGNVDDDYSIVFKATGHGACENITRAIEFM